MPSFAEMIGQNAMKSVADARDPNAGSGVAQGMQIGANLAIENQKNQMAMRELQQKQQQFKQAQVMKFGEFLSQGMEKIKNAGDLKNYLNSAIGMRNASGIDPSAYPDDAIKALGTSENQQRWATAMIHVRSGDWKYEDVLDLATNPLKKDKWLEVPLTPLDAINRDDKLSDAQEKVLQRKNAVQVAATRASATISPDKQLAEFAKQIANPSSRSDVGQSRQMINAADAVSQLANANVPSGATKEQKVAAYDKLDSRQVAEIVRNLDKMLSRSQPTVHGQETLTPETYQGLIAKYGEKGLGVPVGVGQGQFIERMMDTVNRERNLNAEKLKTAGQSLKQGYARAAEVHGDKMDKMIEDAIKSPTGSGGSGEKQLTFSVDKNGNPRVWNPADLEAAIAKLEANNDGSPFMVKRIKEAKDALKAFRGGK